MLESTCPHPIQSTIKTFINNCLGTILLQTSRSKDTTASRKQDCWKDPMDWVHAPVPCTTIGSDRDPTPFSTGDKERLAKNHQVKRSQVDTTNMGPTWRQPDAKAQDRGQSLFKFFVDDLCPRRGKTIVNNKTENTALNYPLCFRMHFKFYISFHISAIQQVFKENINSEKSVRHQRTDQ